MSSRKSIIVALCLVAPALSSCQTPEGGEPTEFPYSFLRQRVEAIRESVDQALAQPEQGPSATAAKLEEVSLRLRQLEEYFLPILEVRYQVERASQAGPSRRGEAAEAIDSAETLLLEVVRNHGRHLEAELREPLQRVEAAREAVVAGDLDEARRILDQLRGQLALMFFRGDLVLEGSELDRGGDPGSP